MLNESQDYIIKNKDKKLLTFSKFEIGNKITRKNSLEKSEESRNFRYELEPNRKLSNTNDEKITNNVSRTSRYDSMIFYKDKFKKLQKKKDYSSSDMITSSMDYNDKTTDSRSFVMNLKIKSKNNNSKNNSSMINKIIGLNKLKKKKKKIKKVSFKKVFVTYIDIESFKKYNMENNCLNAKDKAESKCTCLIF